MMTLIDQKDSSLSCRFGRVALNPEAPFDHPATLHGGISVLDVVRRTSDVSPRRARELFPDLDREDVLVCRAFVSAFSPRPKMPHHALLLDENITYKAIAPLAECFGWCTHVYATDDYFDIQRGKINGRSVPDERVFAHAVENRLAIVSLDDDLRTLSKAHFLKQLGPDKKLRPDAAFIPPLIVPRYGQSIDPFLHDLRVNRAKIIDFMNNDRYGYLQITPQGADERSFPTQSAWEQIAANRAKAKQQECAVA